MVSILKDKIFISTRPPEKSKELQDLLYPHKATLHELPMIKLSEVENNETRETINKIKNYTHLAFTSSNAFYFFLEKLPSTSDNKEALKNIKILSIGYKTSESIKAHGLKIYYDAHAKTGLEFAEKTALKLSNDLNSDKAYILWPTGNLSPNHLIKRLENIAPVYRLNIYKNTIPTKIDKELLCKIEKNEYDMIIIASPSAFYNLYSCVSNKNLHITCIGETTAAAILKHGIKPLAIAEEPNAKGIYQALINYYSQNTLTK